MKNYREIDPQKRHEEFAKIVGLLKEVPDSVQTVEQLVMQYDRSWNRRLDECVVILLEQIRYVLQDVGLEGSALDWLDKLIDFKLSRESKIVFGRFEQTRRIFKAFCELPKESADRAKYLKELQARGIIAS